MKIILSHDVDHLFWSEHYFKDIYLWKHIIRNTKELITKQLNLEIFLLRMHLAGRIHNLPELIDFHKKEGINANFFFGMDNTLGLSYNYKAAKSLIELLLKEGHETGVHGIEARNELKIRQEYTRFKEISDSEIFGIRTHYLQLSGYTHQLFSDAGYLFDSSVDAISKPYKIDTVWEIPISVMDVDVIKGSSNFHLNSAKTNTLEKINKAQATGIPFFVINFHDIYFSERYPVHYAWFKWLVGYFKEENFEFVTFKQAVELLENAPS